MSLFFLSFFTSVIPTQGDLLSLHPSTSTPSSFVSNDFPNIFTGVRHPSHPLSHYISTDTTTSDDLFCRQKLSPNDASTATDQSERRGGMTRLTTSSKGGQRTARDFAPIGRSPSPRPNELALGPIADGSQLSC
ncbi:hypothetical protein F5Y09DRAFT_337878 [Xylaria sp. FL1042]|nr:hypothetical protein F5Y09DRAFT_337878 [Xylaria sp. FL1042]